MNKKLYKELVAIAQRGDLKTYSDIAPLIGLNMDIEEDRGKISCLLEEIARYEEAQNRPMLTAIIVHRGNDNNPGEGFFAIATEFGRFQRSRDPMQRLLFWVREVASVHEYWKQNQHNG